MSTDGSLDLTSESSADFSGLKKPGSFNFPEVRQSKTSKKANICQEWQLRKTNSCNFSIISHKKSL